MKTKSEVEIMNDAYLKYREQQLLNKKRYYQKNKEMIKAKSKEYYYSHLDEIKEKKKAYYQKKKLEAMR